MSRSTILITGLSLVLATALWYGLTRKEPPNQGELVSEPELVSTFEGYVGASVCMQCHHEVARKYRTSGHAHTFHTTAESPMARSLAGTEFKDPLRQGTFRYRLDAEGLSVSMPERFGDEQFPLALAIGSGTHAVTFLTLLPHQDGGVVGLEHRATFYHELNSLGLTVGHRFLTDPVEDAEHFGKVLDRKKVTDCIRCHTTHATIDSPQLRDLIPHVGCESCHGPGRDHVLAQRRGLPGPEIRTEKRWPNGLDEIKTCGACHRMPDSLKATELVRNSRVLPRFQPAGLMQSRCYTESKGQMRCTTCHNPHEKTSTNTAAYERACMGCHQQLNAATCPKGTTGCVGCHMPRIAFEEVTGFHDHWIRVRNSPDDPPPQIPAAKTKTPQ